MSRRPKNRKLKTTEKIIVFCEGETEESYLRNILNDNNLMTDNIKFENLKGGSYQNVNILIEKNAKLIDVAIVVMDLDRCTSVPNEKKKLKKLITTLEKLNIKNNIFLTYNNFENWVAACINKEVSELEALNYKKGNGVYKFINDYKGSFEKGIEYFKNKEVYFIKNNLNSKGVYNEDRINEENSSLYYFIDYFKLLLKK